MATLKPDAGRRMFGKYIGKFGRGISDGVKFVKAPPEFTSSDRQRNFLMALESYQRALETGDKRRIRGIRSAGIIVHAERVSPTWRGAQDLQDRTIEDIDHLARLSYDSFVDSDANTVHIVYVKKNKVISQVSFPKNYPLSTPYDVASLQESVLDQLKDTKVQGADGYYAIQNYPDNKLDTNIAEMHKSIANTMPGYLGGLVIAPGFQYGHINVSSDGVKILQQQLPLPSPGQEFVPGYDGPYTVLDQHQNLIGQPTVVDDDSASSLNIGKISKHIERSRDTTLLIYSSNNKAVGVQEIPNNLFKKSTKFNDYTKGQMNKYGADEVIAVVDKSKVHGATPTIKRTLKKNKINIKLAQLDTKTLETEILNMNTLTI